MSESSKEIIGFLCRWCLLALAAGTVVTAAWAALLATSTVRADLGAGVVVSDVAWRLGDRQRVRVVGYVAPRDLDGTAPLVLSGLRGRPLRLASRWDGRVGPIVEHVSVGVNRLRVRGIPYGALAFCRTEAVLLGVPPGRPVFLVDWRLATGLSQAEAHAWRQCALDLSRRGSVAYFHPGPIDEFARVRRELRRLDPQAAVVCPFGLKAENRNILGRFHQTLLLRPEETAAQVITASAAMAAAAEGHDGHFDVHLIGTDVEQARPGRRVRRHASSAKFKEYLAGRPITQ